MAAASGATSSASSLTLVGGAKMRPFRNVWMLEELGVPYTHVDVFPRTDEANAVNPLGKVPTLKDGDFVLYESAAINTYLGDKFRGQEGMPVLVPPPATQARGRYEQLICFLVAEVDSQGLWIHRKHAAMSKVFGAIPEAVEVAKQHTVQCFGVLAAELKKGGGPFLLGPDFSAADILLVHCMNWAQTIGWLPLAGSEGDELKGLYAYLELCMQRPAYHRATEKRDSKL